jgi:hydroxymethylpyrimidine/phosphomethylpyrimidine kinase
MFFDSQLRFFRWTGIQANIKTFEALNIYSASIITRVTAQITQGVQKVFELPDDIVSSQLDSVFSDIKFLAVKIGMLKSNHVSKLSAKNLNSTLLTLLCLTL